MAESRHTLRIDGKGNAKKVVDDAAGSVDEFGGSVDRTAKKSRSFTETVGKLAAGLVLFKEGVIDSVREGAKLEASQGRLNSAMRAANLSVSQQKSVMDAAAKSTDLYGVKAADANDLLQRLVSTTKDAEEATKLYALAQDIASQESTVSLQQATELLVKAQKGEVEELKKLANVNKALAEDLNKVEDVTLRAEIATRLLTDTYDGLAEANAGTEEKIAATTASLNLLQANAGLVLIEMGNLVTKTIEATGAFDNGELSLNNFAKAMGNFATETGKAADELSKMLKEANTKDLAEFVFTGGLLGTALGLNDVPFEVLDRAENRAARSRAAGAGPVDPSAPQGPVAPAEILARNEIDRALASQGGGSTGGRRQDPNRGSDAMVVDRADDDEIMGMLDEMRAERERVEQERLDRQATLRNNARQAEIESWEKEQNAFISHQDQMTRAAEEAERERLALIEENQARAQEIRNAAIEAGISVVESSADQFIESEAAKAAISAAIETARSVAAFASANIPAGLGHAAAAVQFGLVAATAGKSPPGGAGGGARGGRQFADRRREDVGLLGEQSRARADRQEVAPLTVNINSAFPPSPEQASELAGAVERDRRRHV